MDNDSLQTRWGQTCMDRSPSTGQPTLDSVSESARLAETDPTFWASVFLGPANFAAQQSILTIDQRANDQNDVLAVAEALDVAE